MPEPSLIQRRLSFITPTLNITPSDPNNLLLKGNT